MKPREQLGFLGEVKIPEVKSDAHEIVKAILVIALVVSILIHPLLANPTVLSNEEEVTVPIDKVVKTSKLSAEQLTKQEVTVPISWVSKEYLEKRGYTDEEITSDNIQDRKLKKVFESGFEGNLQEWDFHFGEYGTGEGGESGYSKLTEDSEEVISGEKSLKVVSHPKAYSHSIAYRNLELLDERKIKLNVRWKQLDKNLDSIEFAFNRFTGESRIEGAFQHLVYPTPRWRYYSGGAWSETGIEEEIEIGETNTFSMILDFKENEYERVILNGKEFDFVKPIPISKSSYAKSQKPHTRIHFEHRPKVDEEATVIYDGVLLEQAKV